MLKSLTFSEVKEIHEVLTKFFEKSDDPISPPGIKNEGFLESAVNRQHVGIGGHLKYSDVHSNAATLLYGICMNHSFNNGNKRTALVSALAHLDKNEFVPKIMEDDFYQLMTNLAGHTLLDMKDEISKKVRKGHFSKKKHLTFDEEVTYIAKWLGKSTRRMVNNIKTVRLRELKEILRENGCSVDDTASNEVRERGNSPHQDK